MIVRRIRYSKFLDKQRKILYTGKKDLRVNNEMNLKEFVLA